MHPVFQFILCSICDKLSSSSNQLALSPAELQRIYSGLMRFWYYSFCPFFARVVINTSLFLSVLSDYAYSFRLPRPVRWLAPVLRWFKGFALESFVVVGGSVFLAWLWMAVFL